MKQHEVAIDHISKGESFLLILPDGLFVVSTKNESEQHGIVAVARAYVAATDAMMVADTMSQFPELAKMLQSQG